MNNERQIPEGLTRRTDMNNERQIPEGLTGALLAALHDIREWAVGPPAPDAQVQAWKLYADPDGGVWCGEKECGCVAEAGELIHAADWAQTAATDTFTLAQLHRAIGEHIWTQEERKREKDE